MDRSFVLIAVDRREYVKPLQLGAPKCSNDGDNKGVQVMDPEASLILGSLVIHR